MFCILPIRIIKFIKSYFNEELKNEERLDGSQCAPHFFANFWRIGAFYDL